MGAVTGHIGEHLSVSQVNNGTASSTPLAGTAVQLNRHEQMMFLFLLGDMAAETIDCIVESCDSGGANPATLKAATQLAASAGANDNKQVIIVIDDQDMIPSGKQFVRGKITTGGATGGACQIVALGAMPKYGPAANFDNATVLSRKF